jgi:adenylosuccinate synthase
MSEAGLSPRLVSEVVLVFRAFPIRVAGSQAGPLRDEITWEQLQEESNSPKPLREYTSVTRKLRRLGRFDWQAAGAAITVNRPTRLALNFTDYLGFENRHASRWDELNARARGLVCALENLHVPVAYIGTGPKLSESILRGAPSTQVHAICPPPSRGLPDGRSDRVDLRRS